MRRLLPALLLLGACSWPQPVIVQPRPPEGYAAVRFLSTVVFPGQVTAWEFPADTVLVADRRRQSDGAQLWCGNMIQRPVRLSSGDVLRSCHVLRDGEIIVMADFSNGGFPFALPPGSVEEFRLR